MDSALALGGVGVWLSPGALIYALSNLHVSVAAHSHGIMHHGPNETKPPTSPDPGHGSLF